MSAALTAANVASLTDLSVVALIATAHARDPNLLSVIRFATPVAAVAAVAVAVAVTALAVLEALATKTWPRTRLRMRVKDRHLPSAKTGCMPLLPRLGLRLLDLESWPCARGYVSMEYTVWKIEECSDFLLSNQQRQTATAKSLNEENEGATASDYALMGGVSAAFAGIMSRMGLSANDGSDSSTASEGSSGVVSRRMNLLKNGDDVVPLEGPNPKFIAIPKTFIQDPLPVEEGIEVSGPSRPSSHYAV